MNISKKTIDRFQKKILHFYQENGRDLPWRKTTNPYYILLSEIMLQQTQVSRVISYYEQWIRLWPTIQDLANSEYKAVLQQWMGLGYNRRAQYLHQTAKIISIEFTGDVLTAMIHYKKLPGIGIYTSKAVQIFSANADIATVDTNIRRIFIHEFNLPETISDTELFGIAERCLPKGRSRDWHNALMDYGAMKITALETGIKPKTQQSKFEGSDRQIRAKILRILLKESVSSEYLQKDLKVEKERLKQILEKMKDEGSIERSNQRYHLP
jgi:A/G-specific adenine glycosylase